jgi:hypothetical protein
MIDFNDPGQVTHGGRRIPIDTEEKFEAARDAAVTIYLMANRDWDDDAQQQLERRVRNGFDVSRIVMLTLSDRKARFDE